MTTLFSIIESSSHPRLPPWAAQRITAASEAQIDTWLDDIFEATSVKDLIGDDSERH